VPWRCRVVSGGQVLRGERDVVVGATPMPLMSSSWALSSCLADRMIKLASSSTGVLASSLAKRAPGYTSLGFPDPRKLPYTPAPTRHAGRNREDCRHEGDRDQAERGRRSTLRRLRRKQIITRIPGTHRYQLIPADRAVVVLFTKSYGRILGPGLAVPDPQLPPGLAVRSPLALAWKDLLREFDHFIDHG